MQCNAMQHFISERQREILELVGLDRTNGEIAKSLGYSVPTIKKDLQHLMKLQPLRSDRIQRDRLRHEFDESEVGARRLHAVREEVQVEPDLALQNYVHQTDRVRHDLVPPYILRFEHHPDLCQPTTHRL